VSPVTSRYRLARAAPEPYGGFRSGWTAVGGLRLHDRTRRTAGEPDAVADPAAGAARLTATAEDFLERVL
jgi:hypothetical protein